MLGMLCMLRTDPDSEAETLGRVCLLRLRCGWGHRQRAVVGRWLRPPVAPRQVRHVGNWGRVCKSQL